MLDRLHRLIVVAVVGVVCTSSLLAAERPNVLFIAVDDLNHWVTHLERNRQARTPNIDRLARMGVTFRNAYCAAPACEPSRAAVMGGRRPATSGCYRNGDRWTQFQGVGEGLSAQFLKAGYHVVGAGKIYHRMGYLPEEWSEYMDRAGRSIHGANVDKMDGYHRPMPHDLKDEDLLDWHTVNYCIDQMREDRDKPFFIACGLAKPHLPFVVPRKYYDFFPLDSIELPPHRDDDLDDLPPAGFKMAGARGDHVRFLKSGRWKSAIQSYLATCAYTDMNVGRLLDALADSPHRDNTIVVLWGDHGWSFGEKQHWRKFALWEEPTRLPLVIVAPGCTSPGGVCTRPVDLMSLYPTLCQLAQIALPEHVEGTSLVPLLTDPNAEWDRPALTTYGYGNHAVRSESWRYIRYANGDEELYDTVNDPYEWQNLAQQPGYDDVKSELAQWLPKVNAPAQKRDQ